MAYAQNFGAGIVPGNSFHLSKALPLDGKYLVATIEDRDAHVTGNRAYPGMLVYVEADKKTYQCIENEDGSLSWEEFGFNDEKFDEKLAATGLQTDLENLENYVGVIPSDEDGKQVAESVIKYIDIKTDGIATEGNLEILSQRVGGVETRVGVIENDYLTGADKTELQGNIDNKADASRVKAIEDDYLKSTDKTELTNAIATAKQEAIATVLGEGTDADFDTLKEIADWILSDTTGAAALQTDVSTLKGEMDAVEGRLDTAEGKLEGIQAGAQVNTIEVVKVNGEALTPDENKAVNIAVPTDNKDLANGAGYLTEADFSNKTVLDGISAEDVEFWSEQASIFEEYNTPGGKFDKIEELEEYVKGDGTESRPGINNINGRLTTAEGNITNLQKNKADKATTLAGYGITDAYTNVQVDNIVKEVDDKIGELPEDQTVVDYIDTKADKTALEELQTTVNGKANAYEIITEADIDAMFNPPVTV